MHLGKSSELDTPLGRMMAIANDKGLCFLEFMESRGFERRTARFIKKIHMDISPGSTPIIELITQELNQYFEGKLKVFKTPLVLTGTAFQKQVWERLRKTAYGETLSYSGLAEAVGNPLACRAVANANACNHIAIVIPCHRIIQVNGQLGGYGGGVDRKKWLLDLEGASYHLPYKKSFF